MASSAASIRGALAFVEIACLDKTASGLDAIKKNLQSWGNSIGALGQSIFGAGKSLLNPFTTAVSTFANLGAELRDFSQSTGISVETLSELRFAADRTGISMQNMLPAIRVMSKVIVGAAEAHKGSLDILKDLNDEMVRAGKPGITIKDLAPLSVGAQFELLSKKIAQVGNETKATELTVAIFGRSALRLGPMRQSFDELMKRARQLNLIISTDSAIAAHKLRDTWKDLKDVAERMFYAAGEAFGPTLRDIGNEIAKVGAHSIIWLTRNKALVISMATLATAVIGVGVGLIGIKVALFALSVPFAILSVLVSALSLGLGFLIGKWGIVAAGVLLLAYNAGYLSKSLELATGLVRAIAREFSYLGDIGKEAWDGINSAVKAGDLTLAAKIALTGLEGAWKMTWFKMRAEGLNALEGFIFDVTEQLFGFGVLFQDIADIITKAWDQSFRKMYDKVIELYGIIKFVTNAVTGNMLPNIFGDIGNPLAGPVPKDASAAAQRERLNKIQDERLYGARAPEVTKLKVEIAATQQKIGEISQFTPGNVQKEIDTLAAELKAQRAAYLGSDSRDRQELGRKITATEARLDYYKQLAAAPSGGPLVGVAQERLAAAEAKLADLQGQLVKIKTTGQIGLDTTMGDLGKQKQLASMALLQKEFEDVDTKDYLRNVLGIEDYDPAKVPLTVEQAAQKTQGVGTFSAAGIEFLSANMEDQVQLLTEIRDHLANISMDQSRDTGGYRQ